MVIINAIKCLMCGDTIFSRTSHDFRSCYCGNVSVDGGPIYHDDNGTTTGSKYNRVLSYDLKMSKANDIMIDLTAIDLNNIGKILFDDWNNHENKYGLERDYSYTDNQREISKVKIELLK